MRKLNISQMVALVAILLAGLAFSQVSSASAQEAGPVGVVVAYVPGQSITIVDQSGTQHEYMLSSTLKILPPGRANSLAVGSFVTIIAPASLDHGKQIAVGIVVHPNVPPGWNVPVISATPIASATAVETLTATPVGTIAVTDTATETPTVTGTPLATDTATETATPGGLETPTDTPTATATPVSGGTAASTNGLIEWLRSLFQQILTSR
jgi:hypothetical protein